MNIDTSSKISTNQLASSTSKTQKEGGTKFADELSEISNKKTDETKTTEKTNETKDVTKTEEDKSTEKEEAKSENVKSSDENAQKVSEEENTRKTDDEENIDGVIGGLENIVAEVKNKLNCTDEKNDFSIKNSTDLSDKTKKNEDNNLINNDMNITDPNEAALMQQMNANMNFNSNGQPFSDFMNNNNQNSDKLSSSAKDLAEEQAVLSTMDDNLAMANKNRVLANSQEETQTSKVKTVTNNEGIKKVDKNSNVTVETVVKYDNVVMNESDVDFFLQLVENGQAEATEATAKNSQVSKTLADLIAKSMKDNQPVRIDFDNDISVIIKIGKDGKISADFLPSSQVAEAYLKENLPLLKQKFDDNNIDYDELNHRQQKQDEKDENRKKERKDE